MLIGDGEGTRRKREQRRTIINKTLLFVFRDDGICYNTKTAERKTKGKKDRIVRRVKLMPFLNTADILICSTNESLRQNTKDNKPCLKDDDE